MATRADSPLDRVRRRQRLAITAEPRRAEASSEPKPRRRRRLTKREEETIRTILSKPMDYIDSEEFRREGAEERIYGEAEIERPDVTWYRPLMDDFIKARDRGFQKSGSSILLTGAQERVLFLKYNYSRFRIAEIQNAMGSRRPTEDEAHEILRWWTIAERYREQIAETNLALVLAMAKRTRMSEVDFADLVSEGNMALLRSVDKFDCGRGFKFSTYACRAILKAFSRQGMKLSKYRQRFPTDFDPAFEKSNHLETVRETSERESADEVKHIVLNNEAELSDVERMVISHRFGLGEDAQPERGALTLEQVGQLIGVTKERVRQIQNKALEKLRGALEEALPENPKMELAATEN